MSRSEAIRDLIRNALIEDSIDTDENAEIFGTITMIYDHEVRGNHGQNNPYTASIFRRDKVRNSCACRSQKLS